jgi:hypothetical protein
MLLSYIVGYHEVGSKTEETIKDGSMSSPIVSIVFPYYWIRLGRRIKRREGEIFNQISD